MNRTCRWVVWLLSISMISGVAVWAARPKSSPEQLLRNSTVIVTGNVICTYASTSRKENWETTKYVAEVVVDSCEKGELPPKSIVYARYYQLRWIGKGLIPPGYSGISPQPQAGQSVRLHLTSEWNESLDRESDGGLNVVGPNGVEVLKVKN